MKVRIVSVDPDRPVQFGAGQFGYWGRFQSPEVSGEAILFSIDDGLNGLKKGCTIEANASLILLQDSVSEFRLVPSSETPSIEPLSEPGDYSVVGTVMDIQSHIQVGGWVFDLVQNSMVGIVPSEGQRVSFTMHNLVLVDTTRSNQLIRSFGSFSKLFMRDDGIAVGAHRDLLWLETDAATALDLVRDALEEDDWETYAVKMMQFPQWRFHLVAGCALLFESSERILPRLWKAIDSGSWVTPQLAVVGYFADPSFIEQAKSRVEAGCPVIFPEGLDASEIHDLSVSMDPVRESAKNLATLLFLCGQVPELSSWYEKTRESPEVLAHLRKNIDRSAAITEKWLKEITDLFKERGMILSPAHQQQL